MAKTAFKHFFSKNASVNMPRTRFDMSCVNTTTITTDYLYPVYCQMVLPGDSWNIGVSNFIRMIAPIDVPMMDNLYCDYHFWFIPMRLVWDKTKYFFGEQDRTPNSDTDYTMPQISFDSSVASVENYAGWNPHAGLPQVGSIYDYMGIPIQGTDGLLTGNFSIMALPLRAYNLVADDWYRDEQRVDYSYYNIGDETDTADKYFLLKRGKRFDLATSTLLEPQLGDPVSIPLGTTAPVYGTGTTAILSYGSLSEPHTHIGTGLVVDYTNPTRNNLLQCTPITQSGNVGSKNGNQVGFASKEQMETYNDGYYANFSPYLQADLSNATAATIASLRQAFQMQAYQEIQARGGSRYVEFIYNQFSVIQPDILSRPEFLGGMHQRLSVQPIVQNSATDNTTPQGNLTAIVYGAESEHGFTRSFTEHGFILGIMNIYADLTYFQGLDKMWSIQNLFDIPLPVFGNLTDEAMYKRELVLTGTATDDEEFGYYERYAPWKYAKNSLTGLVRPNAPLTIGQWSLAEQFDSVPENTADFIQSNTPIDRISAVPYSGPEGQKNPHTFIVNQKFSGNVVRALPAYSDPMKWFMRV